MADHEHEQQIIRRRSLGWGISCTPIFPGIDHGRDIVLANGSTGLDFAIVEGMENLAQDLEIGLTTLLGDDIFNVAFGFDGLNALVDEINPIMVRERVRIAIIKLLNKDPRIRRILDVNLVGGFLGSLSDNPEVEALGALERLEQSRRLSVSVEFETITGERTAVNLGKVVTNV